MTATHDIVAFL